MSIAGVKVMIPFTPAVSAQGLLGGQHVLYQ